MYKKLSQIDRIDIASPCVTDWDKMKGNDEVRFCQHCNLNVHNLSAMTRSKAMRLVRKSKGRLCVRYVRRPNGTIQTASRLYQLSRARASRIVAGVFGTALSLSSAGLVQAQASANSLSPNLGITISEEIKQKRVDGAKASIKGTIVDSNGAVIPGVIVSVVNQTTGEERTATTNDEGVYEIDSLDEGSYKAVVRATGFIDKELEVQLTAGDKLSLDTNLEVSSEVSFEIVTTGVVTLLAYQSPLLNAASYDDLDGVREYLAKGVNANTQERGDTALHIAVSRNNIEMVRVLLDAGANPNIRDEGKNTALLMLNEECTVEMIKLLLDAGAKVNVKDEEGMRPLMIAAEFESSEVLQVLLNAGAKVNKRDNEGRAALMIAVKEGRLESVRALLAAGANVSLKDKTGKTALQIAMENDDEEIINWLKAYGAY
jgi:hypothetical protein